MKSYTDGTTDPLREILDIIGEENYSVCGAKYVH